MSSFNSTIDGLGNDELNQPGSLAANEWITGSIYAGGNVYSTGGNISGGNVYAKTAVQAPTLSVTTLSGTNVYAKTTVQGENVVGDTTVSGADIFVTNSFHNSIPYSEGLIVNCQFEAADTAGAGTWLVLSGKAAAAPATIRSKEANSYPLGITLAGTTSGTAAGEILTRGLYSGLLAEETIPAGEGFKAGVGAAYNTVGLPNSATDSGRGTCVIGAGSEGTLVVYLM